MKRDTPIYFLTPDDISRIRQAREQQKVISVNISLTVGFSSSNVSAEPDGSLHWEETNMLPPVPGEAGSDDRSIWKFENNDWVKWQRFDAVTQKFYKMIFVAPGKPPTVEISGIKMHVTQNSDPGRDTAGKLKFLGKLRGRVLDTCLGLGYTAIAAAKSGAQQVYACERDSNMLQLCRENPWSQELFENPRIRVLQIPAQVFVRMLPASHLDFVIHDPPRFALAPELYSLEFYRELARSLRGGGRLYHYTGDPNRRVRKQSLAVKSGRLLQEAGFRRVKSVYQGILAVK